MAQRKRRISDSGKGAPTGTPGPDVGGDAEGIRSVGRKSGARPVRGPVVVEPEEPKSEKRIDSSDKVHGIRKKQDAKTAANKAVENTGAKKPYGLLPPLEILPFQSTLAYAFKSVGGKETAIEAARMVQDEDERFRRITHAWDEASLRDRDTVRLEDLCAAADLTPDEFLGSVIPVIYRRNQDISRIIAAMAQPKVLEATIQSAQTQWGSLDRQMLHQASGFLPTKAGQQINIDNRKQTVVAGGKVSSVEPGAAGLPSFEQDMIEGSKTLRGDAGSTSVSQLRLPAPKEDQAVQVPGASTEREQVEILDAEPV